MKIDKSLQDRSWKHFWKIHAVASSIGLLVQHINFGLLWLLDSPRCPPTYGRALFFSAHAVFWLLLIAILLRIAVGRNSGTLLVWIGGLMPPILMADDSGPFSVALAERTKGLFAISALMVSVTLFALILRAILTVLHLYPNSKSPDLVMADAEVDGRPVA